MKIPFKLLTMAVAGSCFFAAAVSVTSAQHGTKGESHTIIEGKPNIETSDMLTVTTKKFAEKTDLYEVNMSIPIVDGLQDKSFEKELNEEIEKKVMARYQQVMQEAPKGLQEAEEGGYEFNPYMLEVAYKLKSTGGSQDDGKLSIVVESNLYMGGAHGTSIIDTFNVSNEKEASAITLQLLLGPDYKMKANKAVRKAIEDYPERFFPDFIDEFESITEDQQFYIEKGKVVLVFQQGEISPHPVGVMEILVQ